MHSVSFDLEPADSERLMNLCGQIDQHLRQIETSLSVNIGNRGPQFTISGLPANVDKAVDLIQHLYQLTGTGEEISPESLHLHLHETTSKDDAEPEGLATIRTKKGVIRGRGPNQNRYIRGIQRNDLTFGVGPAGTGKTYLAVACAVEALERDEVRRIILVRPAVEAGEKLGFLPGDLSQKVDPYLRPMYDALFEMMGFEKVNKLIEKPQVGKLLTCQLTLTKIGMQVTIDNQITDEFMDDKKRVQKATGQYREQTLLGLSQLQAIANDLIGSTM